MGLLDKMKNFMNVDGEDYEDEDVIVDNSNSTDYDYTASDYSSVSSNSNSDKRNKYVNIHATTQLQVVLVKPDSFADATSIADHLNSKRTVVLNLESTSKDVCRRLVDFLSGVAYANKGQLKRVANSTFIITPFNVDIMGDVLMDELENSGLYL